MYSQAAEHAFQPKEPVVLNSFFGGDNESTRQGWERTTHPEKESPSDLQAFYSRNPLTL